jgi:hypothetical protein
MEIIDKYGYLEGALGYIERNIVAGKNLHKLAEKSRVNMDFLKNLSDGLRDFSEKMFFTILQQELEDRHSSISGADVEISGADISVETLKNKAFVLMDLVCDIMSGDEKEDKIKIEIKIFSKIDIRIN